MGERDNQRPRRSPLFRFIMWLVISVLVVGVVGGVSFMYLAHKDSAFLDKVVGGLEKLATSAEGKEHGKSAEKLRELSKFLQDHGDDINTYGKDVDEKLNEIRKHSESAYQAAKKKVDEYMAKQGEGKEGDGEKKE